MLSAGGGAEASTISQVRSNWKKFRELLPLLTSRVFLHKMKAKLYKAYVRSVMLHGSLASESDIARAVEGNGVTWGRQ